jgi:TPR repeat protein
MNSRRILPLCIYLVVFMCLPVLAQKTGIDPTLLKRADAGDAQAQLKVGEAYASGISVAQDYSKAASWLQKAGDQGLAPAQFDMGALYEAGNGVQQDDTRAASWYQ